MKEKTRVLLFVNSLKTFYWHRQPLAEKLLNEGYEVLILTSEDEKVRPSSLFKFKFISLSRRGINPFQEFITLKRVIEEMVFFRPHIIHNFTVKCVIYGSVASLFIGPVKVINSITGLGSSFIKEGPLSVIVRYLYKVAMRLSKSEVIFQNIEDYNFFQKHSIIPQDKSHLVLGSGVDLGKFPLSDRTQHVKRPVILFASRLLKDKGIIEFVEAIRMLRNTNIAFDCDIAGDVDDGNPSSLKLAEFTKLIDGLDIRWHGYVENIVPLLLSSDVVCLPSYREGTPMILLEAAAAGKGIVATDVPGCRNIVHHYKTGLLASVKDSKDLSLKLLELLKDNDLRIQLGHAARKHVEKSFERSLILSQILEIYHINQAPQTKV